MKIINTCNGISFAIASKDIFKVEIISDIDLSIRTLPKVATDEIRLETMKILPNATWLGPNVSRDECSALKYL